MCSTRSILSPSGLLWKNQKLVDPLGLTNTFIGDPTGRIRKTRAAYNQEQDQAAAIRARDAQRAKEMAVIKAGQQPPGSTLTYIGGGG